MDRCLSFFITAAEPRTRNQSWRSRSNTLRSAQSLAARARKHGNGVPVGVEFHRDIAVVFQFREFLVNVDVVDFARSGLMAMGDVGDVDEANFVEMPLE